MEEAPVVVTAATGALGPVVANLSALLRRRRGEYQLRRGTRKDVKVIRSKLKSIHSILWVIWEREDLDAAGKKLRMEAWRLADDMNDAIDDFILTMKRSSDGKRFKEDKAQPRRPFQDLKRRAVDVSERCRNKWKLETAHTTFSSLFSRRTKTTVDSGPVKRRTRAVDPYVQRDISKLVGMEEPRNELIAHLIREQESTPQLKMACIVGAAGMGKTTLARLVFEAIQDQFQARAFVSLTSSGNMTELLQSILQQVTTADSTNVVLLPGTKASTKNQRHLIDAISSSLKDKRYLVIIDDIWHRGEWKTVKESLPDNNLGSRIVMTRRVINAITDKWCEDFDASGSVCKIDLYETHDLKERIENQVDRDGIQNTPGFEALVESLELGYNDLPHHMLKTCLLYCSIYPKLRRLKREVLVRRWIAQGFVCKEEVAKEYFAELVSRGFITEESSLTSEFSLDPMMRNYLRCKLREHNFIACTSDTIQSSPAGWLCIDRLPASSDAVDPMSGIDDWHHIRSLVVLTDAERVPYKHLEHLRVLDVEGSQALENKHLEDMCGLRRLRHLLVGKKYNSRGGRLGISEMPAEIARLQYLETLEVRRTEIRRLPAEIGDLKQLKTLDVGWNRKLAELPRELGNLQHTLETLIIKELNITEEAWEIIVTLKKLKTLDVSSNDLLSGIIPRNIGNLLYLETLNLSRTRITELPREIGNLQRLQILDLNEVETITKLPREIGKLQHLEALNLEGTKVRKIPREIGGLKKLKKLRAKIGTLPLEAGQLPKLEGLPNCIHTAWKNGDLMPSLAGEILSFETTQSLTGDGGGLVVGTKHVHIPQWIKDHFNNIGSLDIRICTLEEKDLKILREMPYLDDLKLRFEAVPREPVAISGGGFAKLQYLTVDSRVPRVTFLEGAMPRLYRLIFQFQFYGGVPNTDPVGTNHLVHLKFVQFRCSKWYRGDSPCISATIDVVKKEARGHPNTFDCFLFDGSSMEIIEIAESSQGSNEASSSGANEIEEVQA